VAAELRLDTQGQARLAAQDMFEAHSPRPRSG
jgi:hypothetical protein